MAKSICVLPGTPKARNMERCLKEGNVWSKKSSNTKVQKKWGYTQSETKNLKLTPLSEMVYSQGDYKCIIFNKRKWNKTPKKYLGIDYNYCKKVSHT